MDRLDLWLLKDSTSGTPRFGGSNSRGEIIIPVVNDDFIYIRDEALGFDHYMLDLYAGYFGKDGNYFEVIYSPSYGGNHQMTTKGYTIRNYEDDIYNKIWEVTAPNGKIRTYKNYLVDNTW